MPGNHSAHKATARPTKSRAEHNAHAALNGMPPRGLSGASTSRSSPRISDLTLDIRNISKVDLNSPQVHLRGPPAFSPAPQYGSPALWKTCQEHILLKTSQKEQNKPRNFLIRIGIYIAESVILKLSTREETPEGLAETRALAFAPFTQTRETRREKPCRPPHSRSSTLSLSFLLQFRFPRP